MELVKGTPSIRLEGDIAKATALIPEGRQLLAKAQAVADRAGVPTFSMNERISEHEYIYVLIAGEVKIIQISAYPVYVDEVHEEEPEPKEGSYPPDFLSGIVIRGIIDQKQETLPGGRVDTYTQIREWVPTPWSAQFHELKQGRQPSRRLAVEPHDRMQEWRAPQEVNAIYSQYVTPRSSQWTGTMRKVVQLLFGYGKIRPNKDFGSKEYAESSNKKGVRVQYDYKFVRSHGIFRASDGVLWLVEVSSTKGVIAMPLPVFPGSRTAAFRMAAERAKNRDMVRVLDELGCLPTGQGFPTGEEYDKKVAAGEILQLLSPQRMQEFYWLSGYSSACGWTFSEKGHEAHNVGYGYPGGDSLQKGYWYQLNIHIGALRRFRRPNEPLALGIATLRKQREGFLWSSATSRHSYIPVKYYEPLLPGLLSHSARPLDRSTRPVPCDTVVYVGIMNNELKIASYYRPKGVEPHTSVDDPRSNGECLLEGTWTWTETTGNRTIPAMPYTSDIDVREVLEDHIKISTLTSTSQGYDPPVFGDFIDAPEASVMTRSKVYRQEMEVEEKGGEMRSACFAVPWGARDAYYFFEGHAYNAGHHGYRLVEYVYIMDPYVYYGWRKFPRISSPPYPPGFDCRPDNCGGKHSERRVICEVFSGYGYQGRWAHNNYPSDCRSFADSGPWASLCADIASMCSGKAPYRPLESVRWDKGRDFEGTWNFISEGMYSMASGPVTEGAHDYAMAPSPDPETGLVQFIGADYSSLGERCVIYTKGFSADMVVDGYAPARLDNTDGKPAFIGVNMP